MDISDITPGKKPGLLDPFRRAVLRGLAVLLPPLLTIVIFLWVWNTVTDFLLAPMESGAHRLLINHFQKNILPAGKIPEAQINRDPDDQVLDGRATFQGIYYQQVQDGRFVLAGDYDFLQNELNFEPPTKTADEFYRIFVERKFLQWYIVIPFFLSIFLLVLYLLGKFLAAGVGRFFWMQIERVINRLPVIRNVYSSVKQVTDFMFSEREIEYTRVVAVEYPRKGIWTLAMVTGESLLDIRSAANEPVLSVLIPTSPMPFTGFTVTIKKSETIDLNITIDQAFQFIVSCGVVVPLQQAAPGDPALADTTIVLPLPPASE
jgi:uncharacterized membrane protein